jgi:hypothetical protein
MEVPDYQKNYRKPERILPDGNMLDETPIAMRKRLNIPMCSWGLRDGSAQSAKK